MPLACTVEDPWAILFKQPTTACLDGGTVLRGEVIKLLCFLQAELSRCMGTVLVLSVRTESRLIGREVQHEPLEEEWKK